MWSEQIPTGLQLIDNLVNCKKLKIIFLTKYPETGASSRYRVYQYLHHFQKFGFKTQSLYTNYSFQLIYQKGCILKKAILSLKDYLFRTWFILTNLDTDVVYMQREIFAFGPLWAEHLYRFLEIKLVFDLDDALFINNYNQNNSIKLNKAKRVKKIIKFSDLVIAGNAWIRDECEKIGAKNAVHIDVAETVLFENSSRPQNQPMKALWLGSPTTSKYLSLIEKPLKKFQETFGLEINIVGGDPNITYSFKYQCIPWSKIIETKYLMLSDIGLMPLPNNDWSKGKCGGKARTYMASGLIPLVSNIGYNKYLIQNEVSGFLCDDDNDWFKYLEKINSSVSLLKEIRLRNFQIVKKNFNQERIALLIEAQIINLIPESNI